MFFVVVFFVFPRATTHIEVTVEGSYDLLHEMLCKPNEKKSQLRLNNIKTLWTILEKYANNTSCGLSCFSKNRKH